MSEIALRGLPSDISRETLAQSLADMRNREPLLETTIRRFEQSHGRSLEAMENRLSRGEGSEHPDWEDSIEWRNACQALERTRTLRTLLEWLLGSTTPSPAS